METSNIATATGLGMNWVDELNASSQSHYAQDVTAWAQSLLAPKATTPASRPWAPGAAALPF